MTVHRLERMTWEEVRDVVAGAPAGPDGRARVVAILPVGALEAHGPHLPLATDGVIAEGMAEAGARGLADDGWEVLLLPALPYTAAPFAAGFPGTVSVSAEAVGRLIGDVARSLGRHGVPWLALANAHLDPDHVAALRAVAGADAAGAQGDGADPPAAAVVFPDLTRRRWAERLTEEFRSGACHAGRFEGSVVLARRPGWVRRDVMGALEPVPASLSDAIREGKRSFEEAGAVRAYCGWPADATAREGAATVETLGAVLEEAVQEAGAS